MQETFFNILKNEELVATLTVSRPGLDHISGSKNVNKSGIETLISLFQNFSEDTSEDRIKHFQKKLESEGFLLQEILQG